MVVGRFSLGSSRRLTLQWGVRAAARVSFTVETTVLPSFALPRGTCKWEGFVLAKHIFQPRIDRIFTNGEQLRWRFCLLVLFVFIRGIRGSRASGQDGAEGVVPHLLCLIFGPCRDDGPPKVFRSLPRSLRAWHCGSRRGVMLAASRYQQLTRVLRADPQELD